MFMHYSENSFRLFPTATCAVDFFFILSGFVLAHSYGARSDLTVGSFMLKRVIRLYPLLFLGTLIGLPWLFWMAAPYPQGVMKTAIAGLTNAVYLPYFGWRPPELGNLGSPEAYPINGPEWSLFFELAVNIIFLYLVRLSMKVNFWLAFGSLVFMLVLSLVMARAFGKSGVALPGGWDLMSFPVGFPRVIFGFSLGIAIYRMLDLESFRRIEPVFLQSAAGALVVSAVFVTMFTFAPGKGHAALLYLIQIAIFCPLFVVIGAKTAPCNAGLTRIIRLLGFLSYPIYCIHIPVKNETSLLFNYFALPTEVEPFAATFLTFVIAALAGKYLDIPVRRWLTATIRWRTVEFR
ncbi:peptidoglycan/LPS O-acetylase OafA/YrhL [Novosphingobium sediminicola]|uniref:Peptidoglycan/LPS O-acetylase OafA/YrhL n=2 Tax=Novosphingobium sediminicola TaxID=563162 RepID=A0A7W6CRF0_9SPHN|nr:peptidoglycan/LPS O-acetylase OafA/YrhL [Novosphingobium sediminicola]